MSVSKGFVQDRNNVNEVLAAYLAPDKPTLQQVALRLGTTFHNVQHIVTQGLSKEALKAEQALRYSRSKMGPDNPMTDKSGSQHHGFKGDVPDGHGYLQRKVGRRYEYVHRIVMAEALGMTKLPEWVEVHHIDEDKTNNALDNLAVVTKKGHRYLHAKRSLFARSPLWAQWVSGTSKSLETTPT